MDLRTLRMQVEGDYRWCKCRTRLPLKAPLTVPAEVVYVFAVTAVLRT
ncbi:hypothetical protein [Streptomyces violascens]